MSSFTPISPGLTCQKCGCPDESQRLAVYPFVYSIGYFSFHREFKGRWCRKHQTMYRILAGLISATAGLMGLPGLYYAPKNLWKLAEGGFLHKDNNVKQLRSLAEAKQQRGDREGALACQEASFFFRDDLWVRQELHSEYTRLRGFSGEEPAPVMRRAGQFAGLLLAALVLGFLVGAMDYAVGDVLPQQLGGVAGSLRPFFQWPVLFGLGVASIFLLQHMLANLLTKYRVTQAGPAVTLALLTALALAGGVLEGRATGDFVRIVAEGAAHPDLNQFWITIGAVLTRGALLEAVRMLQALDRMYFFHTIFLSALTLYAGFALLTCARSITRWMRNLREIETQAGLLRPNTASAGWAAVGLCMACLVGLTFIFPQQSRVDFLEARDHYQAGWDLEYEDTYEQANREFALAVQLDPYMAEAYEELGWTYGELNQPQEAITQYLKAIALKPERASTYLYLARSYHETEQTPQAVAELETAVRLDPEFAQAYMDLGWNLYTLGELAAARTNLERAIELDPELSDAYIGLGYIYEDEGNGAQRVETLKKATRIAGDNALAFGLLGIAYYDTHEIDLAIDNLEEAIARKEDARFVRTYLSMSYLKAGKVDQAVKFTQESLALDAEWAAPSALLASAYAEMNQTELALEALQAARAISQKTDLDRILILDALLDTRQYAEAEIEAQEGELKGNYSGGFILYQSEAQSRQKRFEEAGLTCERAEQDGARPVQVLIQKADLALQQDQAQAALDLLNQAAALDPQDHSIYSMQSWAYLDLKNDAAALEAAQKAVQIDRYSFSGMMSLAEAQLNLGSYRKSREAALRAAELSPHLDTPHYLLAMTYMEEGDAENAVLELDQFVKLYRAAPGWEETRNQVDELLKKLKFQIDSKS